MITTRPSGAARSLLKLAASAADRIRRPAAGVVILIYHRVGATTGVPVDLPTGLFTEQMDRLAASGRVISLEQALDRLGATTLPDAPDSPDPVVVTFDDGTADYADVAVPIMAARGIPSTLYLATEFIEEGRAFPDAGKPLSWQALADVMATGLVSVGSHTHRHALLDRVDAATAAHELDRSIGLIGDRLGVEAKDFAYPKAVAGSPAAEAAVRARFRSAALAGTRANPIGGTDPYRLCRTPIQTADGMRWFERKLAGGMALEDSLRRLINRRRYASSTS